ncbi:PH domain-containing protein [Rhabdothermincola salaria]|uniref:PH domain-containing protein n=1 Tax=Rhabdothermincola salaria TaxID=2903142 RepID=UPI001E2FB79E|nr:PH domain-containing protein [Rhabdothermincola salaria]MCD9624986.1 PH domain-containing protein [Rhabdothermincola salaria]
MPYPQDVLHTNESLVLDLHPHWWYMASSFGGLLAAAVVAVVALANDWPDWFLYLSAAFVLGTLIWFVERYIRWVTTHFVLTSDRVIYRSGVIAKRGIEIPLERINTIFFNQTIFERVLGLGDLEIESASKEGSQRFDDIRKPDEVQNEIYQQIEANEIKMADRISGGINVAHAAQSAAAAPPQQTVPEQIEHLARLRDQGVLTDEEFQAKKAELLGRM